MLTGRTRWTQTLRATLVVGTLLLLLGGCANQRFGLEPPTLALVSLRLAEATMLEQRFDLRLRITNPNPVELPLEGLSYALRVSGVEIGSGVARPQSRLAPFSDAELDLTLNTSTLDMIDLLRSWNRAPPEQVPYALEGRINVGRFAPSLPFARSGNVDLRMR